MNTSEHGVTVWLKSLTEEDIEVKDEDAIEQIAVMLGGGVQLWFNTRDDITLLHEALTEYLAKPTCEFCDKQATTTESDELGNDCRVCDDHAEMLAAKKPERAADQWYDDNHKSGEH